MNSDTAVLTWREGYESRRNKKPYMYKFLMIFSILGEEHRRKPSLQNALEVFREFVTIHFRNVDTRLCAVASQ